MKAASVLPASPLRGGDSRSSASPSCRFSSPGTAILGLWRSPGLTDPLCSVVWDSCLAASICWTGSLVSSCLRSFASSRLLPNYLFLSAPRDLEPGPTKGLWALTKTLVMFSEQFDLSWGQHLLQQNVTYEVRPREPVSRQVTCRGLTS